MFGRIVLLDDLPIRVFHHCLAVPKLVKIATTDLNPLTRSHGSGTIRCRGCYYALQFTAQYGRPQGSTGAGLILTVLQATRASVLR